MHAFRRCNSACILYRNFLKHHTIFPARVISCSSSRFLLMKENIQPNVFKEIKLVDLDDPDCFGTLSGQFADRTAKSDEGDIKEEKHMEFKPSKTYRLTTKQYADIIKQYLKHKRLKEALDVLQVRMIEEDRVKPENYIYNILIDGCAEVGYTHQAFKLYNDMKHRALKATGATYTCLFKACANSPFPADGLKRAKHLRQLMVEKCIEPNLSNYNVMIKAFGRCDDLSTAFQIVDEMVSKKIKIRVHTFNFLLQACITDKKNGLRHALIVWRKMLQLREKPNIYSFNLMLKCVKDCNFGSQDELMELISLLKSITVLPPKLLENTNNSNILKMDTIKSIEKKMVNSNDRIQNQNAVNNQNCSYEAVINDSKEPVIHKCDESILVTKQCSSINTVVTENSSCKNSVLKQTSHVEKHPNFLSRNPNFSEVLSLQLVEKPKDKFQLIGGLEGFLNEMKIYNVTPDIKTINQCLPLIEESIEAEENLIKIMKSYNIKENITFYNTLIKKRCLRSDYDNAWAVMKIIHKEGKFRKIRYKYNKKLKLKPDILTYGCLAMTCKKRLDAENFLKQMEEEHIKPNIEIFDTMLRQATTHFDLGYILYVINRVRDNKLKVNEKFMTHLKNFNDLCLKSMEKDENGKHKFSKSFEKALENYFQVYGRWLDNIDLKNVEEPSHPWYQFKESIPETVQKQTLIKMPKRFIKPKRAFVKPYVP